MICRANQLTGFYVMTNFTFNELTCHKKVHGKIHANEIKPPNKLLYYLVMTTCMKQKFCCNVKFIKALPPRPTITCSNLTIETLE